MFKKTLVPLLIFFTPDPKNIICSPLSAGNIFTVCVSLWQNVVLGKPFVPGTFCVVEIQMKAESEDEFILTHE